MEKLKKVIGIAALSLMMTLGIMMLPQVTQTVYADGSGLDVGSSGNGTGSGHGSSQEGSGGPCWQKTGFYVTVSVADSETSPSHAIGYPALLKCQGGYGIPAFDVASQTRINGAGTPGTFATAPWPYPAFVAGKGGGTGYGGMVKSWLLQDNAEGQMNAVDVAVQGCGVTVDQILQLQEQNKVVFVNVEPVMFCNNFTTTQRSSMGGIICGLTTGIGAAVSDTSTWISSVTRGSFPKSFRYEKDWQGISTCADAVGLFSTAIMTNKSIGCGIVSVKLNDTYQVVICVEDNEGGWTTEYLGSGPEYDILAKYAGADFVEATFSRKKTQLNDPNASYSAVCSSGAPNRGVGVGHQQFKVTDKEEALFIHYKGSTIITPPGDADLYAHEVAYLMPKYAADREDGAEVDNEYTLKTHIEKKIEEIKGKTKSCPHNDDYTHANNASGSATVDKVTCRDSEDWENQYTGVKANLGQFPNASWNLYRESVSGEKWDTFNNALNDVNKWKINEPVDPQFSYYLTRSHLEDVAISPDRDGSQDLCAALNIAPSYTWESVYTGKDGASQASNTTGVHDVDEYVYKFTFYGYELEIYYHFECNGDYWETGSYGDWDNDSTTPDTYKVTDSETHPKGHKYNQSGDDWSSVDDSTIYEENSYTPSKFKGNTGDHQEEKYKTKNTPSGQSTRAGDTIERTSGTHLGGQFVKGANFDYTATTGELVGSQFQGVTFTIYPEVAMTVWAGSDAENYTDPTESICYVMGELPRHYTPPIAHSYKCSIQGGSMQGLGSLASAAVGSAADSVDSFDLGVTAMGTTFEVATKSRYVIDIYTTGCTLEDSPAHSEWGNEKTDVADSHEQYVASILAGMQQELIMEMTSSKFDRPYYYVLLSSEGDATRTDDNAHTSIFWHAGGYDEEGTVQGYCNTMWGPTAYTEALQYTPSQILDTMFVSCNDGADENNSNPYSPHDHVGTALGDLLGHGAHWYDEESKDKMRVEYYHTHVVFGLLNADDKIDYNLLTQSAKSRLIDQTDSIHVSFYTRLFNDQDFTAADGYTWSGHTGTYMIDRLHGTDFSVLNQTTSQMKSN